MSVIGYDQTPLLSESRPRVSSVTPLNADVLLQMVQQNDDKAEEGHHRLRQDIRALEGETGRILSRIVAIEGELKSLGNRQPVFSNVLFPWHIIAGSITLTAIMVGAMWAITYGLRSDVRDLVTTQIAHTKLEDERYVNTKQMLEMQRALTESVRLNQREQIGEANVKRR